ncbi:phage tail protein [Listeria monocytogenes]
MNSDIIVADFWGNNEEILTDFDKESFCESWTENEMWNLEFKLTLTNKNAHCYSFLDYESSVFYKGQEFIVKQLSHDAEGRTLSKNVKAPHIYYTCQDGWQESEITGNYTLAQCLMHIFKSDSRGFTWEIIDPENMLEKVQQENFGNKNYLTLIDQLLEDYGVVVIPDNKHLVFKPREIYGAKTENFIRYRYNTDEVSFDIDTLSLKTKIKGYGKVDSNGNNYFSPITYTSPETGKWGIRWQEPISDERYTVAGNMQRRLKLELQDYPATTGSTTLKKDYDCEKGDYVLFIYEPLNIDYDVQIVAYRKYPFSLKATEIILSNNKKSIVSIMAQLAKTLKGVK